MVVEQKMISEFKQKMQYSHKTNFIRQIDKMYITYALFGHNISDLNLFFDVTVDFKAIDRNVA